MPERRVRMKSKTVKATLDNLDVIQQFIEEQLEGAGCPAKVIMQISMAVEAVSYTHLMKLHIEARKNGFSAVIRLLMVF